jgi:hypothetical protein
MVADGSFVSDYLIVSGVYVAGPGLDSFTFSYFSRVPITPPNIFLGVPGQE